MGPRLIGRGFNFYRVADCSVEIDKKIVFMSQDVINIFMLLLNEWNFLFIGVKIIVVGRPQRELMCFFSKSTNFNYLKQLMY